MNKRDRFLSGEVFRTTVHPSGVAVYKYVASPDPMIHSSIFVYYFGKTTDFIHYCNVQLVDESKFHIYVLLLNKECIQRAFSFDEITFVKGGDLS